MYPIFFFLQIIPLLLKLHFMCMHMGAIHFYIDVFQVSLGDFASCICTIIKSNKLESIQNLLTFFISKFKGLILLNNRSFQENKFLLFTKYKLPIFISHKKCIILNIQAWNFFLFKFSMKKFTFNFLRVARKNA